LLTYLRQVLYVLEHGDLIPAASERTGTGTISIFGLQGCGLPSIYDQTNSHPVVTAKYTHLPSVVTELFWFLGGHTNIRGLLERKCRIWSEWPHRRYVQETRDDIDIRTFEARILADEAFAERYGDIGPCYGRQWRRWADPVRGTVHDQLAAVIEGLKRNPCDRGLIMSGWNVADLSQMALRPCHTLYQWRGTPDGQLDLVLYQRSADMFLGVPFNIASAALLNAMVAQCAGMKARRVVHYIGDAHIYQNHIAQVRQMLGNRPMKAPTLVLDPSITDIDGFTADSVAFEGYTHHGRIAAPVAI